MNKNSTTSDNMNPCRICQRDDRIDIKPSWESGLIATCRSCGNSVESDGSRTIADQWNKENPCG